MKKRGSMLIIACGALAHEITALKRLNGWNHVDLQCLRADLHNHPEKITAAVKEQIDRARDTYERIYVGYADCGTGGLLEPVVERFGAEMLPGAHCYEFFAGSALFAELHEEELGTFYLTDFLVKHFDRMVLRTLGLDRHPELRDAYFGNYRRLVYLSQLVDPKLEAQAAACAERLGLEFEHRHVGYGELATSLGRFVAAGEAA